MRVVALCQDTRGGPAQRVPLEVPPECTVSFLKRCASFLCPSARQDEEHLKFKPRFALFGGRSLRDEATLGSLGLSKNCAVSMPGTFVESNDDFSDIAHARNIGFCHVCPRGQVNEPIDAVLVEPEHTPQDEVLLVRLESAQQLLDGAVDAYVTFRVEDTSIHWKSPTARRAQSSATWSDTVFLAHVMSEQEVTLRVECFDSRMLQSDRPLGHARVTLSSNSVTRDGRRLHFSLPLNDARCSDARVIFTVQRAPVLNKGVRDVLVALSSRTGPLKKDTLKRRGVTLGDFCNEARDFNSTQTALSLLQLDRLEPASHECVSRVLRAQGVLHNTAPLSRTLLLDSAIDEDMLQHNLVTVQTRDQSVSLVTCLTVLDAVKLTVRLAPSLAFALPYDCDTHADLLEVDESTCVTPKVAGRLRALVARFNESEETTTRACASCRRTPRLSDFVLTNNCCRECYTQQAFANPQGVRSEVALAVLHPRERVTFCEAAASAQAETQCVRCPQCQCAYFADHDAAEMQCVAVDCEATFCAQCLAMPFHTGDTCERATELRNARKCRFCNEPVLRENASSVGDVCAECEDILPFVSEVACPSCGHQGHCAQRVVTKEDALHKECRHLPGDILRDDSVPCLSCEDMGDCVVCGDELRLQPCVRLVSDEGNCGHIVHIRCIRQRLTNGWPGARVTFGFASCPHCRLPLSLQSGNGTLSDLLRPIFDLKNSVTERSIARWHEDNKDKKKAERVRADEDNSDGADSNDDRGDDDDKRPLSDREIKELALASYAYFQCYECHEAYFAGDVECGPAEEEEVDRTLLLCKRCKKVESMETCETHGPEYVQFKCRYCCSLSRFHCWGCCHFCKECHKTSVWETLSTYSTGKNKRCIEEYEQCESLREQIHEVVRRFCERHELPRGVGLNHELRPQLDEELKVLRCDPSRCKLGIRHAPNGFEFGIGCVLCNDAKESDRNEAARAQAKLQILRRIGQVRSAIARVESDPWNITLEQCEASPTSSICESSEEESRSPCERSIRFAVPADAPLMGIGPPPHGVLFFLGAVLHRITRAQHRELGAEEDGDESEADRSMHSEQKWINPALPDMEICQVKASSLMADSAESYAVLGRKSVRCVTKSQLAAHFSVELHAESELFVRPTHYLLRHYDTWDTEAVRNWQLEASLQVPASSLDRSNDQTDRPDDQSDRSDDRKEQEEEQETRWLRLSRHEDDARICSKGQWAIFKLPELPAGACFNRFRVRQTGHNSNGHKYLALSGFELFGDLSTSLGADAVDTFERAMAKQGVELKEEKRHFFAQLRENYRHANCSLAIDATATRLNDISKRIHEANGALYFLGTRGRTSQWENPALQRRSPFSVQVRSSPLMSNSVKPEALCGLKLVRCVTKSCENPWISVDLRDKYLVCTHYALRHYSSWDIEAVRSWRLEGSNDGAHFETLDERQNDETLHQRGQMAVFEVPPGKDRRMYRVFRVRMTGPNSNAHMYLALSGIELFGELLVAPALSLEATAASARTFGVPAHASKAVGPGAGAVADSAQLTLRPSPDYCNSAPSEMPCGLLHWLGSHTAPPACLATEYRNPHGSNVVATTSSLGKQSRGPEAICGREVVRCVTRSSEQQWLAVALQHGVSLRVSHYLLRHYSSWDTEALRNWVLEGSYDGQLWHVIRQHTNDIALTRRGQWHVWPVSSDQYYRHFRVRQTGRNSNNHLFLALSGLELFGSVRVPGYAPDKQRTPSASPAAVAPSLSASFGAQSPVSPVAQPSVSQPSVSVAQPSAQPSSTQALVAQLAAEERARLLQQLRHGGDFVCARPAQSAQVSSFGESGVLYTLGTQFRTAQWTNPATRNDVFGIDVQSTPLSANSLPVTAVAGREAVRCVLKTRDNNYFVIDLKNFAVQVSHYALQHYTSHDGEALRNWVLEGSTDGQRWTMLREHRHDVTLRRKGQICFWSIMSRSQAFRFLRLRQCGLNSNGHRFLACSGIEFYGRLFSVASIGPNGELPQQRRQQAVPAPVLPQH